VVELEIQWAAHGEAAAIKDVSVNHGSLHIRVAEEFLHSPDIIPGFEEVGGERVAERMAGGVFGNTGSAHSLFEGPLQARGVYVVTAHDVGARVPGQRPGWKDTRSVPCPFPVSGGILALQGHGKIHRAVAPGQVVLMELFDGEEMRLQRLVERVGHSLRLVVTRSFMPFPSRTTI